MPAHRARFSNENKKGEIDEETLSTLTYSVFDYLPVVSTHICTSASITSTSISFRIETFHRSSSRKHKITQNTLKPKIVPKKHSQKV